MDTATRDVTDLAKLSRIDDPVGDVMRSLRSIPRLRAVLDTLGEHPQPVDAARAALADRPDLIELLDAAVDLIAARLAAAQIAAHRLSVVAETN